MSTNFFVNSPREESYREVWPTEDGVPTRAVDPGLGCRGLDVEEVEASARGDAERIEPASVGDRIGVDKRRFVEDKSTAVDGDNTEYEMGDTYGDVLDDIEVCAGEQILEYGWSNVDFNFVD